MMGSHSTPVLASEGSLGLPNGSAMRLYQSSSGADKGLIFFIASDVSQEHSILGHGFPLLLDWNTLLRAPALKDNHRLYL